jgi:HSP20 family protein
MLNTLKQTGHTVGRELSRAWDNLAEGWRELLSRSGHALTQFRHHQDDSAVPLAPGAFPRWSLLAGELEETPKHVVVRLELPGMDLDDCRVTVEGNALRVSGEKRFERDTQAEASYKNGVLTVRLPKLGGERGRLIQVS